MTTKNRRRLQLLIVFALSIGVSAGLWCAGRRRPAGPASGSSLQSVDSSTTRPTLADNTFRVATMNIDGGQGKDGRLDLSRTAKNFQRINIIGLNEVHAGGLFSSDNQAHQLASLLKLPYQYLPAERRWGKDSFGNALLSDLPIQKWDCQTLPSRPGLAFRNYTLADVNVNSTLVHVVITHVDWKAGGDEQLQQVGDVFLNLPTPAILMGDMNHGRSDSNIQRILHSPGVIDAVPADIQPPESVRVDWIFIRGLKSIDAGVVDFGASDHPAYWAQLQLEK